MSRNLDRYRWSEAQSAWDVSRAPERRVLELLTLLPFAHAQILEPFVRASSTARLDSLHRTLDRLATRDLVDLIRPTTRRGRSPRLYYLTDLGLAATSLGLEVDAVDLARSRRLGQRRLLDRLPGLRPLLAAYDLLGAVAQDAGGEVKLKGWECPWRRRVVLPRARSTTHVSLPAWARLGWPEGCEMEYFLLPDLGSSPVLAYGTPISRLTALSGHVHALPTLVIAAPHSGRVHAWRRLLTEVADARRQPRLSAVVTTWRHLRRATEEGSRDPESSPGAAEGR